MKPYIYFCAWVLILGCLGVPHGFAEDSVTNNAVNHQEQSIQAKSAETTKSSTQFQNVEGTLKAIQGNVYVVEGKARQNTIRVEVGKDTAFPNGKKEPGQLLHALITTSNGHALIIR